MDTLIQNLTPQNWGVVLALVGSGAGVSVLLQVIKHYGKLQEAQKLVMTLLGLLSLVATYADGVFQFSGQNQAALIGAHLGWVVTAAVFVHRFAVSPIYYKITNWLNRVYADAQAYRAEQATNAAPAAPVAIPAQPQEFALPAEMSQP